MNCFMLIIVTTRESFPPLFGTYSSLLYWIFGFGGFSLLASSPMQGVLGWIIQDLSPIGVDFKVVCKR